MAYTGEQRIRLTILYLLWSKSTFPTLEGGEKKVVEGRLPKSSMKHQPERDGLQWPDRAVTSGTTTTNHRIRHKLR